MYVFGEGIPYGAYIVSITNSTSFVINASTTGGDLSHQKIQLLNSELSPNIFVPTIKDDNKEIVEFYGIKAHIGRGLNSTDAEYATLVGNIRYIALGQQSQTFKVDLTKIFELA